MTIRKPLLIILSAAFALSGCGKSDQASQPPPPSTVPVVVADVQKKDVPVQIRSIGNVEPNQTVEIKSQITAQVMRVNFTEGQDVQKGQLLFELDPGLPESDLRKAEGTLLKDQATAANAKADASRYAQLLKEGVVARQQAESMSTAAEAADATVAADKAAVENAKVNLTYSKIYAPISGRTGNLNIHAGNIVKANADTSMVVINEITPIKATFAIPQQYLESVQQQDKRGGLKVNAFVNGQANDSEAGHLSFVDNTVDPTTGTIKLKGIFPNADRKLWPGQYVDVVLTLSTEPNAITVPSQAVQTSQNGSFVFVVKPDLTAESRAVTVERTFGNDSIISKGLQAGEKVVTDGQVRLNNGTKVEIKSAQTQNATSVPVSGR
jgi:membrane fusion protein, multidrug efflux system